MGGEGSSIVDDNVNFPEFKAVKNVRFHNTTCSRTANHALTEMSTVQPHDSEEGRVVLSQSECTRIESLAALHRQTEHEILKEYLPGFSNFLNPKLPPAIEKLVQQLQIDARDLNQSWEPQAVIKILAGISAVWTMMSSGVEFSKSGRNPDALLRVHQIQVIALIRLLKLSQDKPGLWEKVGSALTFGLLGRKLMSDGHMLQVGTGEGKSVLLGILSCFLAMIGIQVRCACYSKLLSKRDEKDFKQLFIQFNVEPLIVYSTIDELAEECINEKGDVRDLALCHVSRSSGSAQPSSRHAPSAKRVLLIDEVTCVCPIFYDFAIDCFCVRWTFFSAARSWDKVLIP
jgi:hypothetical protein